MNRVVAVFRAEAVEHDPPLVRLAVAVRVLQEHQVRLLGYVDAAVAELEPGRKIQAVGKNAQRVGPAIPVPVFEHDELVIRFLARHQVRIGRCHEDPETSAVVERHRERIRELGELMLGREQVDFVPVGRMQPLERDSWVLRVEIDAAPEIRLLRARLRLPATRASRPSLTGDDRLERTRRDRDGRQASPGESHRRSPAAGLRPPADFAWVQIRRSRSETISSSRRISGGKFTAPNGSTRRPTTYSPLTGRQR